MSIKEKLIPITCTSSHQIDISLMQPIQGNLKDRTREQLHNLKSMILKYGFSFPIYIWQDGETYFTLDGHGRDFICKELVKEGYQFKHKDGSISTCLPCIFIDAKDRVEAKGKLLAVNSSYGKITDEGLLAFLNEESFRLNFEEIKLHLDLPTLDLAKFADKHFPNISEEKLDEVPEPQKEAISKTGDLFLLDGKHRVMCGDSTLKEDVELLMAGKKADMVFTDPPYNIGYDYWDYIDKKDSNEYYRMMLQSLQSLCNRIIITTGHQNMGLWFSLAKPTHVASWVKLNSTSGCKISKFNIWEPLFFYGEFKKFRKRDTDCFQINNTNQKFVEGHSCPKQVNLLTDIIENYSGIKELVLDIFLGSGSTLIACEQTNRICYGMEIDPVYIDVILRRYHNLYPDKKVECVNRDYDFKRLFDA